MGSPSAADNRTLLNQAERNADPDRYDTVKSIVARSIAEGGAWDSDPLPSIADLYVSTYGGETTQTATRLDASNADRLIIHGGPENPERDAAEAIQLMLERKAMRLNASSGSGTGSGTAYGVMSSSAVSALDVSSAQPLEVLSTISGMDIAEVASLGPVEFQQVNDELVANGGYDRFGAMGSAWSDGRYGDFWRHLTFDASDAAKTAAAARSYQPPSLAAQRLDRMLSSPIGTIASLGVKAFGGSQTWQDAALLTGSFGENAIGGALGLPRTVGPAQSRLASAPRGPSGLGKLSFEDTLVLQGDALRARIVQQIGVAAQPSIQALLKLDPNARIGFRGSLASGLKGPHKLGDSMERVAFDGNVAYKLNPRTGRYEPYAGPQGYDADFFVVSDKLAGQLGNSRGFMDASRLDRSLKPVFDDFGSAMQADPILSGMKRDPVTFRVWSQDAMDRKIQAGDSPYFFLPAGKND